MATTKKCKYCQSDIDIKASVCPYCQKKQSSIGDAFKVVIAAIALIIFVPAIIGACSRSSKRTESPSTANVEVLTTAEKNVSIETGATDTTTAIETEADATEVETTTEIPEAENVVVYDQNGVKITYTGIEEKPSKYELKFLIENNTDIDRTIIDDNLSVNGFMIRGGLYSSVAANKKINDNIGFYKKTLEENNITDLQNVEFIFRIYESNNLASFVESDIISINIE